MGQIRRSIERISSCVYDTQLMVVQVFYRVLSD